MVNRSARLHARRSGWGLVLVALVMPALASKVGAAPPTARLHLYQEQAGGPSGRLTTTFARSVETVDPLGAPVGIDEPRYEQPELFVGAPRVEQLTQDDWSESEMLSTGYALDGTPLWIYNRRDHRHFVELWSTEPSGTIDQPGPGAAFTRFNGADLFDGEFSPVRAQFRSASVYRGAVVIAAEIIAPENPLNPGQYIPGVGLGIFVGNHDGTQLIWDGASPGGGLNLAYTDSGLGLNPDASRVRNWSVTGPFVTQRDGSAGTEVWFCVSDYRRGPDSTGGSWVLLRAHRATEADPWTFDPPCEVVRVEQDGAPERPITHAHTAGVAWDRATGRMTFVAMAGDTDQNNVWFAADIADPAAYADASTQYTPGWWTGAPLDIAFSHSLHDAWLAHVAAPITPTAWGPVNYQYLGAGNAIPGATVSRVPTFQAMGIAPGPTPNCLIIGADNVDTPGMARLDVEECPAASGARLHIDQIMLGNSGYQGLLTVGAVSFAIKNPTPESAGPYVTSFGTANFNVIDTTRLLYGVADGERVIWGVVDSSAFASSCLIDGAVYRGWSDPPRRIGGLEKVTFTSPILGRPNRLGQGASNLATELPTDSPEIFPGLDATAQVLTSLELDTLPPRPFLGPVIRLELPETPTGDVRILDRVVLRHRLARFSTGDIATRVWLLAGETDPPRNSAVSLRLGWRGGPSSELIDFFWAHAPSHTRWTPVDLYGSFPPQPNLIQPTVRVDKGIPEGSIDQSVSVYLGLDSLTASNRTIGYPLPVDDAELVFGLPAPSEDRRVIGVGADTDECTVIVAGMNPHDGMDFGWFFRCGNEPIPVLTVRNPRDTPQERPRPEAYRRVEYPSPEFVTIEVTGGRTLQVRTGNGPPMRLFDLGTHTLSRGDTYQFAFTFSNGTLKIDAVVAGSRLNTPLLIDNAFTPAPNAEVIFGDALPLRDTDLRLLPQCAFGVGWWDHALSDTELEQAMHDPEYLRPLPPGSGVKVDELAPPTGTLDWRDIAAFLRLFAQGDRRADMAPPFGTLDEADVRALLERVTRP